MPDARFQEKEIVFPVQVALKFVGGGMGTGVLVGTATVIAEGATAVSADVVTPFLKLPDVCIVM
jgi:hypothetical protein